jgi:iron complex transport system ATP-binding protein
VIACAGVVVEAGRRTLLRGVSLAAEAGSVLALTGPNGAGKSTLLHVLAGDRRPSRGAVRFFGQPVETLSTRDLAKVRAVLPQRESLSFPFTVLEVVLLGRAPHVRGTESDEDHRIAIESLAEVGLAHLSERHYTSLSGGERQRVQLARTMAQIASAPDGAPRALLLDEPTTALDVAQQHRILASARRIARAGAAVLVVLHDLTLAARYCDRMAVLHGGELRALGAPADVLTEELLRDVFQVRARVRLEGAGGPGLVVEVEASVI